MRRLFLVIIGVVMASMVQAADTPSAGSFSTGEIARIKAFKALVQEVDQKSLTETVHDLEKSPYPHLNLQMKEAMARVYADLVEDKKVEGKAKKAWLYSMVSLNMAYLQFEGTKDNAGNAEPLNRLIRRKLKECLPKDIIDHPGFRCSLG